MENLKLYDRVRAVPQEAQKTITGGKLNGMTDINPMWRIKTLTEEFGPCGVGWYPEITKQWTELGADGRVAAFCNINLYVRNDGEWSKAIPGTGGSMLTDLEKGQQRTSDEAYKMAYTDALSVACKALGIGADIYYAKDRTKYDAEPEPDYLCESCGKQFKSFEYGGKTYSARDAYLNAKTKRGAAVCKECFEAAGAPQ